jgi:hypothetical protein
MFEFKSPLYWKEMRKIRKEFEAQAARNKQQADEAQATETQASRNKPQAVRRKHQASSHKRQDP